jgi:hypothetical protein
MMQILVDSASYIEVSEKHIAEKYVESTRRYKRQRIFHSLLSSRYTAELTLHSCRGVCKGEV